MAGTVKIGNRLVGEGEPCFVVAEIGINHNGDLELAKKLIDASIVAGCDAVKFQKRTIDVVYTAEELAKPRENPFGSTNGDLEVWAGIRAGENTTKLIATAASGASCGMPVLGRAIRRFSRRVQPGLLQDRLGLADG